MKDLFMSKKQQRVIKNLIELTAKMDDSAKSSPFIKMTRSPYHLVAWFLIFAATEPEQIDNIIEKLQKLCSQHDVKMTDKDLKFHLINITQHDALLEILSRFKDKINIDLNIKPQQFIAAVKENGYEK